MEVRRQHFFPAMAARDGDFRIAWLEHQLGQASVSLRIGRCGEDGEIREVAALTDGLRHFLEPRIRFVDDETYLVALSAGEQFGLQTWLCRASDDGVIASGCASDGDARFGALDLVDSPRGLLVVWESWGRDATPILKSGVMSSSGSLEDVRALTPNGVSANWPSAVFADDALWVAFSVPKQDRSGYDCFLLADTGEKVRTWRLNDGNGAFNVYPDLSVDATGRPWITWLRDTDQEYYHLTGQIADSTYCCLQDPLSRSQRRVLWNATEPVVVALERRGDKLVGNRHEPTGQERADSENRTIHYPSLHFSEDNAPVMVFDCRHGACFDTRQAELGSYDDADAFFQRTAPAGPSCHLPHPTRARAAWQGNNLFVLQEVAEACKQQRSCSASDLSMTCHPIGVTEGALAPSEAFVREPSEPKAPTPSDRQHGVLFGNIHIHTELSRCRRDTQQSVDLNYRWAKDLIGQDFVALADHIEDISPGHWLYCLSLSDFFQFPGHYVALPAYEWARKYPDGHANVTFPDTNAALCGLAGDTNPHLQDLWESLEQVPALAIPHHTATTPMDRDWDLHDPALESLVEIFQDRRGNYEYPTAPWEPGDGCPEQGSERKTARGFVDQALRRGYKLGFCSGGDHMGLSGTGIYGSGLNAAQLYQRLQSRACFGASKPGISVHIAVLGDHAAKMGETSTGRAEGATIAIHANACSEIAYVALIHDARELVRLDGNAKLAFQAEQKLTGPAEYVYARVMLEDGNMAWSSPIWFA